MIMVLVVIGYDDDDADNDVDHFQVLPNAISKVVVFIFMAIKLWLSPHSLLGGGDDDVLLPEDIVQFQEGNQHICAFEHKELGIM